MNVKLAQGGGLCPVVVGEDHLPAEGEAVQTVLTLIFTIGCTLNYTLDPNGLGLENANIFNKYQPIVNIEALYM